MSKTRTLTYTAISIALAVLLSYVKVYSLPQGGSATACSMLFIVLPAYWFGPVVGVTAGVAAGFLDLLLGGYVVHPAQLLLDYPLAFGALGLAGFFGRDRFAAGGRAAKLNLHIGYCVGVTGRLVMHFLSGWLFFAEYTPEGMLPALYSLGYQASYLVPEAVITLAIIGIPTFREAIDRVQKR